MALAYRGVGGVNRNLLRLAALLLASAAAASAVAGPFAEAGDARLRQDVDMMKAAGLIEGPIDSWPLPWAQIDAGIDAAHDGRALDPYLAAAVARVDALSEFAAKRVAISSELRGTTGVAVARGFDSTAREKADVAGKVEFNGETVSLAFGAGYRTDQRGHDYHFEPSQAAIRLGNWALYGGWTETWFGPGQDGALLFSNSTRPLPKVGIKRLVPHPIDLPVLRWLGPLRLDFFIGVQNEHRRDFDNIGIVGTRISFEPSRGFTVGVNRMQQLCGKGRPCGLKQIAKSFIGVGNADNPVFGNGPAFLAQAGNQIAGFDLAYVHRFRRFSTKVYFETEAEDSQHIIIEQFGRVLGTTFSGPWGNTGAAWQVNVEYADTLAAQFFNGTPLEKLLSSKKTYPRSFYQNSLYFDGYTYRGLPIGYWTGGDSRNLTASFALTDTRNRRWHASVRSVHLNITNEGNPPYLLFYVPTGALIPISQPVSASSEKFAILTGGVDMPTPVGDLKLEARYQTDSPNTPDYRKGKLQLEIGLRTRF